MAPRGKGPYKVGHRKEVTDVIRELGELAARLGIKAQLVKAIEKVHAQLQSRPLDWGDPEYRLKKQGGIVCHALCTPLVVKYAVFELEHKVMILSITPMPNTPLAQ